MSMKPEIRVTLSDDLLSHLKKEAEEQRVPLLWLVAGLVCDTLENAKSPGDYPRALALS
ncbi:hypothetical protein OJF2_57570 [Aquisphaera giovannonii]|uniref:CopG-like ribbon-helix-helix domain-containing protein n=1 Tax=Aquisphaera giovannonii TaxID=406548 RepID=A0A5B9WBB0_9BACT|nr:hypothetical protein [Aquisphaera giovannonii]QEH37170.1 hypothetical protein OJF2_57570 [Aquisphaera giovannonii]